MGRRLINRQYKLGSRAPSMQTLTGDSGIANLSPYLTINGSTVAPTFVYHGNDATATTWPAQWGNNLTVAGSGTAPTLNHPMMGNGITDSAVKFNTGEYYNDSLNGGQVATEDFVIEAVISPDDFDGNNSSLFSTRAGAGNGVLLYRLNSSNKINLLLSDGTLVQVQTTLTSIGDMHYIVFLDRSGSGVAYVNGVQGTATVISGSTGTLATAATTVGANTAGSSGCTFPCAYLAMWQKSAWLDTHLQAAVALERFQKWSGIYPTKASGTAAPTYSRDCSAYATKWNGTSYDLINCSAGLPRVDYVLDDSGTPFKGMLIEPQATNLLEYSNDFDNAIWIKLAATIDTSTGVSTPDSNIDYQGIVTADAVTLSAHGVRRIVTTTAANHTFSVIAKAGAKDWIQLENSTTGDSCYFDLDNGAVGTSSGTVDNAIDSLGNGNYLISTTMLCTAAGNNFRIYSSEADGDRTYTGDGTSVETYIAFAQVELGNKPTSRIYTAGASATRLADDLQHNGDNVTDGQGTFKAEFLVDEHSVASTSWIADLHNSAISNSYIDAYINTSNQPNFRGRISGVTQWWITGSGDMADGDIKMLRGIWETNNAKQYINSSLDGTPDISCSVPTGIDEVYIGQDSASANQINGRIRNVAIYSFASSDV